jgi:O-antigen ligase
MFLQHPIAGAGFGGYWAEIATFHEGSGVLTPQQAHNDYLEVLASGGLVGAAILVWFAIALIRQTRRTIGASDGFQRAVSLGVIVAVAGVAVHSVVDFGLHITVNALVLMALLAILSLNSFEESELQIENLKIQIANCPAVSRRGGIPSFL